MRDEAVYISGTGFERIDLNCASATVWAPNDLHASEWAYDIGNGMLTGAVREPCDIGVDIALMDLSQAARMRRVFDRDIANGTPGALVVNGYSQRACATAVKPRSLSGGAASATVTFALLEGVWRLGHVVQFAPQAQGPFESMVPYDLPCDLAPPPPNTHVEASAWFSSPMKLTVYGPCVDPAVEIGGNRYEVSANVPEGARVEVDQVSMTAVMVTATGDVLDVLADCSFGEGPGTGAYIFQPLPAGVSKAEWDGSFGFDVEWYEEEGAPPWNGYPSPSQTSL